MQLRHFIEKRNCVTQNKADTFAQLDPDSDRNLAAHRGVELVHQPKQSVCVCVCDDESLARPLLSDKCFMLVTSTQSRNTCFVYRKRKNSVQEINIETFNPCVNYLIASASMIFSAMINSSNFLSPLDSLYPITSSSSSCHFATTRAL